jgi:hypothetical protein
VFIPPLKKKIYVHSGKVVKERSKLATL